MQQVILLTGVAGFIASRVAEQLLSEDWHVIGVDNLNNAYDTRLKEYRLRRLRDWDSFNFMEANIEERSALEPLFRDYRFDGVLNLAARAGVRQSMENPHVYISTNVVGTLNLLELMRQYEVRKIVLASTSSLYAGQSMPFHEELAVNTPISPYAASKKAAEVLAYSYHHLYDLDVSVVRYFTVYGPAGRPDMSVFRFIQWIDQNQPIVLFGDGGQSRDFTYVDDIAAGTIAALKPTGYEIINLGGGNRPVTIREAIWLIEKMLGKQAIITHKPFHQADIQATRADISKAKRLLDWQPQISFEEGLQRTVNWYQDNLPWSAQIVLP